MKFIYVRIISQMCCILTHILNILSIMKGYKTPIDAWEPDVAQFSKCAGVPEMSTPYTGLNHMGLCGKMNVYYWLFDDCQMFDVPDPIIAPPGL